MYLRHANIQYLFYFSLCKYYFFFEGVNIIFCYSYLQIYHLLLLILNLVLVDVTVVYVKYSSYVRGTKIKYSTYYRANFNRLNSRGLKQYLLHRLKVTKTYLNLVSKKILVIHFELNCEGKI